MNMAQKPLPEGFRWGNEVPPKQAKQEPVRALKQETEISRVKINSLREALFRFTVKMDVTKEQDVKFEGMRIGVVYNHPLLGVRYLVVFKREYYYHFSKHFPNAPDAGYAVVCNLKLLYWCQEQNIRIAAVFPDAKCYYCDPIDFVHYYETWNTEVPHLKGEGAYPLRLWKRLF